MIHFLSWFAFVSLGVIVGLLILLAILSRENRALREKLKIAQAKAGWNAVVAEHWRDDAMTLRRKFDLNTDTDERWFVAEVEGE